MADAHQWRAAIDALTGAHTDQTDAAGAAERNGTPGEPSVQGTHPAAPRTPPVSLGLQFELRQLLRPSTWEAATSRAVPASVRADPGGADIRLGVRPVMRKTRTTWTRANLSWTRIGNQLTSLNLNPEHHRWMVQFAALSRSVRDVYYGQDTDWLSLDDFSSALLWPLLAEARELGIELVGTGRNPGGPAVVIAGSAALRLDAERDGDELVLAPTVVVRGGPDAAGADAGHDDPVLHSGKRARAIGTHGLYLWPAESAGPIVLVASETPIGDEHRTLLDTGAPLVIPGTESDAFFDGYYPRLRRVIEITTADDTIVFPEPQPPVLALAVSFSPAQTLSLRWSWHYDGLAPVAITDRESLSAVDRDAVAEDEALGRVIAILGRTPPPHVELADVDAAEFTEKILPLLRDTGRVRVTIIGDEPAYREITDAPRLIVSVVESDQRDWFDLGVHVVVDDTKIPFQKLFRALSLGRKKLLLIDNSYFSLAHPAFDRLRELIHEASELDEWRAKTLRISRYQASLWSDFEDLADETEQVASWRASVAGLRDTATIEPVAVPASVRATLRPYQREGFSWLALLYRHKLGGILADDMGLGKTLQALTLIAHANETDADTTPFLVVAPTSVVPNWAAEAARFTPTLRVSTIAAGRGKRAKSVAEIAGESDIVVTSYALFRQKIGDYQAESWAGLILDEAQFIKNRASRAHSAAAELGAPFTLAITGTPFENNLMELWSILHVAAPGLFPSARRFGDDYLQVIERGRKGVRNAGESATQPRDRAAALDRLRRRIRPVMMRRTKELVAPELPPKQEQILRVELGARHRALYDTFLQRERQKLLGLLDDLEANRMLVFRSLTLLRLMSLDASLIDAKYDGVPSSKLDAFEEQLDDVIAEGHRALVFSQFTGFLSKTAARLEASGIDFCYLDGSTRDREAVISRFRNGTAPVFLISLKAGGFGLNLTEADYVFMLDPWWNPASEAQAIDRTHRIGQTKNVMVYRLVAADTIEEKVMALKDKKAALFESVLDDDGTFSTALSADDLRGLLA